MDNKKIVSFPGNNVNDESKEILMFCVMGGKIFYFFDSSIINLGKMGEGNYLELKIAYTVETKIFSANAQHPVYGKTVVPQAINIVNTFVDMKFFYEGIGYIPLNSNIIKAIKETQTGVVS